MTAFIRQEATEKAREIEIKADEEFAIEKSKLVQQETAAIDAQYGKKSKQASMSQQITRSTVANRSRIRVLAARQDVLDDLIDETREKLNSFSQNKDKYLEVCKNLILESLYILNEDNVTVRARKSDFDIVRKAAEAAAKLFKDKTHQDVDVHLDERNPHPEDQYDCSFPKLAWCAMIPNLTRAGGVSVIGGQGKIAINNTLEERLRLLENEALPSIRLALYGPNKNRKFYD